VLNKIVRAEATLNAGASLRVLFQVGGALHVLLRAARAVLVPIGALERCKYLRLLKIYNSFQSLTAEIILPPRVWYFNILISAFCCEI
jgi:hypothetical protein